MDAETTIEVICGYFRANGFFEYNVKCDDFAKIISKYIIEPDIQFGNNIENINTVDNVSMKETDCLNKQFIISVKQSSSELLRLYNYLIHLIYKLFLYTMHL